MKDLIRVKSVHPTHSYRAFIEFTDGSKREIDLEPYLHGPIFEALRKDPRLFQLMKVDQRMGTIVWENGADIDPDVLTEGLNQLGWSPSSLFLTEVNLPANQSLLMTSASKS